MKRFCISLCAILSVLGCSKDPEPLTVDPSSVVLYSDGTVQLKASDPSAEFTSEDTYYAEVSKEGLVTGNLVGETSIIVSTGNDKVTVPVAVLPLYTLYPDMDQYVGKTRSSLEDEFGTNYSSGSVDGRYTMIYKPFNSYCNICFILENDKVYAVLVAVSTSNLTMLTKSLTERYLFMGIQNDIYYFRNHDKDVIIGMTVESISTMAVLYMKNTSSKASYFNRNEILDLLSYWSL